MARIVIVDNDEDILELLRIGLESSGHVVRVATSGLAALRLIEEELPEVLITDLIMPGITGEKLLKIVQTVPEWRELRTIVVSGVAAEAPELRNQIPCDIYIAKGPIAGTLKYIQDAIMHFERVRAISADSIIGIDDIHSRHVTRELIEFKEEIDSIMNQITDGICRVDAAGNVLVINRAFIDMLHVPEEQILGRNILSFLRPEDQPAFSGFLTSDDTSELEVDLHVDGANRLIRAVRLRPASADDPALTILWKDVTDRLLSEEHYENIVESTSDLILTTDREGRITYVGPAVHRMLGKSREELIGRFPWQLTSKEKRAAVLDRFTEALSRLLSPEPTPSELWEMPLVTADGEELITEVKCAPFRNKAKRVMGMQIAATDVTKRRHLEQEREALLHEVQHRVRDNLQLVASLVSISRPEQMNTRIAVVSEVFDELYRENSFSRITARSLLERIVHLGLDAAENTSIRESAPRYSIDAEHIPMRTAVPLSLLIVEIIGDVASRPGTSAPLHTSLAARENKLVLTLECPSDPSGGTATAPQPDDHSLQESRIIEILTSQLHGESSITQSDNSIRYTVSFVSDKPVP